MSKTWVGFVLCDDHHVVTPTHKCLVKLHLLLWHELMRLRFGAATFFIELKLLRHHYRNFVWTFYMVNIVAEPDPQSGYCLVVRFGHVNFLIGLIFVTI